MKRRFATGLLLSLMTILLGVGGCGGMKFPKLYPLKVTLTNDSAPLDNVMVTFRPKGNIGNFTFFGVTDENGTCDITAYAADKSKAGLPAGEFTVILKIQTQISLPPEETKRLEAETVGMKLDEKLEVLKKANREQIEKAMAISEAIPEKFRERNTSPISFSMEKGKGDVAFDLSQYPD